MHQVVILAHDQQVEDWAGVDAGIFPAIAVFKGAVGQVVKKQTQGNAHHQGGRKPVVEDVAQKVELPGRKHQQSHRQSAQEPLQQLIVAP